MTISPSSRAHAAMAAATRPRTISWYRTPIESSLLKALHQRSDAKGAMQTLGYLAVLVTTGLLAFGAAWQGWVVAAMVLVFLHGTVFAFLLNAVHELAHGTVFKTRWMNALSLRVFAFLSWTNFEMFQLSHARHHRHTLHPPDDLEVVLPMKVLFRQFLREGFVNPYGLWVFVRAYVRWSCGRIAGEWEEKLLPEGSEDRRRVVRWARIVLGGHALIVVGGLLTGLWMIPVLVTLAPFYGSWLFFLCNNTQHIGLQDNVDDFRLCCRTFRTNPVIQFLYWHMNFHIEHHMYAAVPCYHLGRLHQAIRHDLGPCPDGLVATWKEIAAIQRRQKDDPSYQYVVPLPAPSRRNSSPAWPAGAEPSPAG